MELQSEFIFIVCQAGAEPALKKEIAKNHPHLRFAFSRPGYVTFKNVDGPVPFDFILHSVFARAYGVSFGPLAEAELTRVLDLARTLRSQDPIRKIHLQAWERDLHIPGEEPLGFVPGALLGSVEVQLRKQSKSEALFEPAGHPQDGDSVIQLIALDPGKFGYGLFTYSTAHSPYPGGSPPLKLPNEAPSRAYLKLENSILWSGAPLRKGDLAVEIGSSPGGASYAMLQRGLNVIGIDPGAMDRVVLKHPNFKHIQRSVAHTPREDLPESIQWLILDMNVEPNVSLYAVDRLVSRMKDSLLGVLLTVKLNQWKFADEIPYFMSYVKAMGMTKVKATQLAYNRQEIMIYGLTRRGMTR
jgi:23S rRNA (cytidine2498-2'-O)-methyltransferase